MDILEVANSSEEIKNIWDKQLTFASDRLSKKTDSYFEERQGASLRAFEYLPL
jgi:hypothetical protein